MEMNGEMLVLGVLWYVVLLFSTTCHEAGHALAAKLGGDLTAYHGGQVSLDPIPHIRREPFGMVLVPWLTYLTGGWMMGWASAPYDPYWAQRYPHRAGWMALAGPAANMVLVLLSGVAMRIGILLGAFDYPRSIGFRQMVDPVGGGLAEAAAVFLSLVFSLNVLLGTFNLLPVPPLDGYGVIGLLMPESTARRLESWGQEYRMWSILGLVVAWNVYGYVYRPIVSFFLVLLYPGVSYG